MLVKKISSVIFRLSIVVFVFLICYLVLAWAGKLCIHMQLEGVATPSTKIICAPIIELSGLEVPPDFIIDEDEEFFLPTEPTSLTVRRRSKQSFNLTPWTMKLLRGVLLVIAFAFCGWVVRRWIKTATGDDEIVESAEVVEE